MIVYMVNPVVVKAVSVAIRKVKGGYGVFIDHKKNGRFQSCGRSKLAAEKKRKYPKCVPRATANRMTKAEIRSAVRRKRAAGNPGGKPTMVKTFAKRKKKK